MHTTKNHNQESAMDRPSPLDPASEEVQADDAEQEDQSRLEALQAALDRANHIIAEQRVELALKTHRISELEQFIAAMTMDTAGGAAMRSIKVNKLSIPDESGSVVFSRSAPGTLLRDVLHAPIEDVSPIPSLTKRFSISDDEGASPVDNMHDSLDKKMGLDQRLALNASQRRKLQPKASSMASKSTGCLRIKTAPLESSARIGGEKFVWSEHASKSACLFIAHDNPQLGKTVHSMLANQGHVLGMLESHNGHGTGHFLLGEIIFSGEVEDVQGMAEGEQRGSLCLILTNLTSTCCDVKALPTRTKGDIIEVDLTGLIPMQSDALEAFWKPCKARVDVILDPYHDGKKWFPYFEGRRKMAPQFRSKGVGYLRLGDDMSNYGTAFLSLDAGTSYLDNGATNIVQKEFASPDSSTVISKDKLSLPRSIRKLVHSSRSNSACSTSSNSENVDSNLDDLGCAIATFAPEDNKTAIRRPLSKQKSRSNVNDVDEKQIAAINERMAGYANQLRNPAMKWAERVSTLQSLLSCLQQAKHALDAAISKSNNAFLDLLAVLSENLKQSNPQVITAVLRALEGFSDASSISSSSSIPWREIVLEVLSLLRSNHKLVADTASSALHSLYRGQTFSLQVIVESIGDILTGSRAQAKKKTVVVNAGKVLMWLQSLLLYERTRCLDGCTVLDKHDLFCLWKALHGLVSHREESTREACVSTLAVLLSIEACQGMQNASRGLVCVHEQVKMLCQGASSTQAMCDAMQAFYSEGTMAMLADIKSSNAKGYEKICSALAATVRSLAEDSSSAAASPRLTDSLDNTALTLLTAERSTSNGSTLSVLTDDSSTPTVTAGVRGLKRRLSSRCKLKTVSDSPTLSVVPDHLHGVWYELKLLLQRTPSDEKGWDDLVEGVKQAHAFFPLFLSAAQQQAVSVGALLQRVLPFNEHTSSADQASTGAAHVAGLDGELASLAKQVVSIRSMLRVKMADEADFGQARLALATLEKHLEELQRNAGAMSWSLFQLVDHLE